MAKKVLEIDALNAFRINAILKTARPRQKNLQECLPFALDSLESFLRPATTAEGRQTVSEAVTKATEETVNYPPPVSSAQLLAAMGYTNPTYSALAGKITIIVRHYQPAETVLRSEVIQAKTVGGCIEVAIKKAKL